MPATAEPRADTVHSITFGSGFTHDLGPRCRNCQTFEAHCAREGSCCDADCTHFGQRLFLIAASSKGGRPRTSCDDCRTLRLACPHGGAS